MPELKYETTSSSEIQHWAANSKHWWGKHCKPLISQKMTEAFLGVGLLLYFAKTLEHFSLLSQAVEERSLGKSYRGI